MDRPLTGWGRTPGPPESSRHSVFTSFVPFSPYLARSSLPLPLFNLLPVQKWEKLGAADWLDEKTAS